MACIPPAWADSPRKDKAGTSMFDKELLKIPGMRGVFALLAALALVQAALVIGQTFALATALAALWRGASLQSQAGLLACFIALFAARRLAAFGQDEFLDAYARKQAAALRSRVLGLAFGDDASLAHRLGTASTALAVTDNLDDVERYLRVVPPKLFGLALVSLPVLAALFATDWVSGVIALAALPVIVFFMVMLGRQAQARAERQFAESAMLSNRFIDTLRGLGSLLALGAADKARESVVEASEKMRVATVRTLSVATLSSAVLDLITVFGIAAIAMMLAFRLMDGSVDLGTALPALMLAPEYFAPIRSFAGDFHASLDGRTALASLTALLEAEEGGPTSAEARRIRPWSADSTFAAHGVSFAYGDGDGEPALRDVSFALNGFSKVGIVGASGAGKSTLADLVAGFAQPSGGSFEIDGAEADLNAPSWRKQVQYVPQHPHVFHATLRENVMLYARDADDGDVERAVAAAGLDRLVSELPDGVDTVIGESGRGLSGGEAQRIALARILLGSRGVLLFDEPTAHLDIETELELKQRMLACMEGRLVFFATHRLHWLSDMDYVVVLDNGAVSEAGTPSELLAGDGALARLALPSEKGGAS